MREILAGLTKPVPDHLQLVGPRFSGKTVILHELVRRMREPSSPYIAVIFWDLGHRTPATDEAFMQRLARELSVALEPHDPAYATHLANPQGDQLQLGDKQEVHSSSGIIVSTGLGSTGWFKSLISGAIGIAGGISTPELAKLQARGFAWDAPHLYFTVREPFPSKTTQANLVFGKVVQKTSLRIVSQMPDYGVILRQRRWRRPRVEL